MKKRLSLFLMTVLLTTLLAACGESTATNVPAVATTTTGAVTTVAGAVATTTGAATTALAATTTAAVTTTAAATTLAAQAVTATTDDTGVFPATPLPTLPANAKKGGTLTLDIGGPLPVNLPAAVGTQDVAGNYFSVNQLFWEPGLLSFNYYSLRWELGMAKDLKVDATGKVFTFTLRNDLKWSDGSPITVDDLQYTYDNISKPNPANPAAQYAGLDALKQVASYKADAATNTIVVTMNDVYARDIAYYDMGFSPAPKKVWEGKPFFDPVGNPELKKPSVVSGPYMIESYDPNTQGVLVANPNWFRGRANFDKIILKPISPNLMIDSLRTNQADASFTYMPPAQYNEVKANPNLNIYDWYPAIVNYRYLVFNTTKPPFDNKSLRQAIIYATDRKTLIQLAENGRAVPQYDFVNENSPFYNPDVNHYDVNLDTAKKVLTDAGYTFQGTTLLGKDGQPLKFTMSYDNADPPGKLIVTYLQAQLKKLGIEVAVEGKESQSYLVGLVTKKYDVGTGITGGTLTTDPDSAKLFFTKAGLYNVAGYVVPRLEEIFATGSHELDNSKRKLLYNEAQKILTEDLPSATLYAQINYIAASKKLGGITTSKGAIINQNNAVATWYFTQ